MSLPDRRFVASLATTVHPLLDTFDFGYRGRLDSNPEMVVRRIVLLSTLTPGRCFTLAEPVADFDENEVGDRLLAARSILVPEAAWKYVQVIDGEVESENAMGDVRRFALGSKVSELPRQGWDRLSERVRGEA